MSTLTYCRNIDYSSVIVAVFVMSDDSHAPPLHDLQVLSFPLMLALSTVLFTVFCNNVFHLHSLI